MAVAAKCTSVLQLLAKWLEWDLPNAKKSHFTKTNTQTKRKMYTVIISGVICLIEDGNMNVFELRVRIWSQCGQFNLSQKNSTLSKISPR